MFLGLINQDSIVSWLMSFHFHKVSSTMILFEREHKFNKEIEELNFATDCKHHELAHCILFFFKLECLFKCDHLDGGPPGQVCRRTPLISISSHTQAQIRNVCKYSKLDHTTTNTTKVNEIKT